MDGGNPGGSRNNVNPRIPFLVEFEPVAGVAKNLAVRHIRDDRRRVNQLCEDRTVFFLVLPYAKDTGTLDKVKTFSHLEQNLHGMKLDLDGPVGTCRASNNGADERARAGV